MREYLFLFTIGPVQPFIENSRKMRELYAGSFLLSYLILHVFNKIDGFIPDIKIEKILPVFIDGSDITGSKNVNAPNRILLKVVFSEAQTEKNKDFVSNIFHELAQKMETQVRTEFGTIYKAVFQKCHITPNASILTQLQGFPQVHWAYQEYIDDNDFEKITAKMQAVKSVRTFSQTSEKAGRKCALFPEYNALFFRKKKNGKDPDYMVEDAVELTVSYALKPGEAISAIAFVKRMLHLISYDKLSNYKYNNDIVSVAYLLLKDQVSNNSEGQALLEHMSPEAAEAIFDLQNGLTLSNSEYENTDIDAANKLFQYMQEKRMDSSPYYAVIKFDGDGMGELYRQSSATQQEQLSKEIGKFAACVPAVMEDYHGMCIYAGGEDFLGFFPISKAFLAMIELRKKFQNIVRHPFGPQKLTFSAGIVFSHIMPPLKNVLALTDRMEREAKSNQGKDSFAISVSKRSGTSIFLCEHFGDDGANLGIIYEIFDLIRAGSLSISGIYGLLLVLDELSDKKNNVISKEMLNACIVSGICSPLAKSRNDMSNVKKLILMFEKYNCNIDKFCKALEIAIFLEKEASHCIIESIQ